MSRVITLAIAITILTLVGFSNHTTVYGEVTSLQTNSSFYKGGDKIMFSGTILPTDQPEVTLIMFDPNDLFLLVTSGLADSINHTFQITVDTGSQDNQAHFSLKGMYNATAFVTNKTGGKTTSFFFSPDGSQVTGESFELQVGDGNGACEGMGGIWESITNTCSFAGTLTQFPGNFLTVDSGVIFNNSGTITCSNCGGEINNSGTLNNNGVIKGLHSIINQGTINNNSGGNILNILGGYTIDNSGTLNNLGVINNTGIINNRNFISNSGTINNNGSIKNFCRSSTINNTGIISSNPPINLVCSTSITLKPITSVPWGKTITVSGQLQALYKSRTIGMPITFNGTGAGLIPSTSTTDIFGHFSLKVITPKSVQSKLTLQAHFVGDSSFEPGNSNIVTFSITPHHTSLVLAPPLTPIPWGKATNFITTLSDVDQGGTKLSSKKIHFLGNGVIGVADVLTNSSGVAIGHGTAPKTVNSGLKVQAFFNSSDTLYHSMRSTTLTYNTSIHSTTLTMNFMPGTVSHGKPYSISGVLKDSTFGVPLKSTVIQFVTNNSAVIVPSILTNSTGGYNIGLVAPNVSQITKVQILANYAGSSLYTSKSVLKTLTIK